MIGQHKGYMAYNHFDVENFEASVTKYLVNSLAGYPVIFDESTVDFDLLTEWYFVEFLGNNGQIVTQPPINHILIHIRTRGEDAEINMRNMTRIVIENFKDKIFTLYDLDDNVDIGKLRSVIVREFPKESARQAMNRGFNRSILLQISYGKAGVAYTNYTSY